MKINFLNQLFFLSLLWCLSINKTICQTYQNSLFKGVHISLSGGSMMFNSSDLVAKSNNHFSINAKLYYGLTERIAILANYSRLMNATVKSKEIGYFISTTKSLHENTAFGLRYNFLTEESKIRLALEAVAAPITSTYDLLDDKSDNAYVLNLKGLGYGGNLVLDFFPKPFYSIEFSAGYINGSYKESEYFGTRYKENTKYNLLSLSLGLAYHFSGR